MAYQLVVVVCSGGGRIFIPLCVVDEVLRSLVLNFIGWSGIVFINDSCACLPRGSGVVDATVVLCLISVLDEL